MSVISLALSLPLIIDPVGGAPHEALAPEGPALAALSTQDASQDPGPAVAPEAAPAAAEPDGPLEKKKEWMLVVAPGFDFIRFQAGNVRASYLGGALRFGGHAVKWGGARGRFFVGGGPILRYSFWASRPEQSSVHLITADGDLLLGGGGRGRWAVYGHLFAGFGAGIVRDTGPGTNANITVPIGRVGAGVGGFGKITDRFSLGGLVDTGWVGGLWINAQMTANFHFGRGGQPV